MADEATIIISILFGVIATWVFVESRKKTWYLEVMSPRQHYEVGKEKKVVSHMEISGRFFNGIEAGKYKLLLLYGDLSTFSKPILGGKLEEMYMTVLARSLVGRKFVTKLERFRFLDFIFKHIPSLSIKAYMITGELVSPQEVLDHCWKGDERDTALSQMKRRGLIDSRILWIKPYPPENKLKEILTGQLMIPDLIFNHEEEYARVATSQRETLIKMDSGFAIMLKEVIVLEREIVTSISDPLQVLGMIIVDRARKIEGLGLEQLAEKGGMTSIIQAAKRIQQYRADLTKALAEEIKPEELEKIEARLKKLEDLEKRVEQMTGAVAPTAKTPEK